MNALSRVGGTIAQCIFQPLGKSNNLFVRIANIAIPLLALGGVVAAAYYAFSGTKIATKLKPMVPVPPVGQAALAFALEEIRANPNVQPTKFATIAGGNNTHQPVNPDIAKLTKLYRAEEDSFNAILKELPAKELTSNAYFLKTADKLMKLSYAIGVLTLQDLDAFVANTPRTKAKALATQDSYQYRTYYFVTVAYHYFRSNGMRNPDPAHAALFYSPGTKQNEWNQLYNDFCDRVRMHVIEADLQRADNRLYTWTAKDTGPNTFYYEPDTLPT